MRDGTLHRLQLEPMLSACLRRAEQRDNLGEKPEGSETRKNALNGDRATTRGAQSGSGKKYCRLEGTSSRRRCGGEDSNLPYGENG